MKKGIYRFNFSCGRQGDLTGVFISTQERVDKLIETGIEVYFGEVLGKHSEIYGSIEKEEIEFITDDEKSVSVIETHGLTTGYNPFGYTSIHFELEGEEYIDDLTVGEIIDILIDKNI